MILAFSTRCGMRSLVAAALVCLLPQHGVGQTIRDSAGIRIATHSASARPQRVWRIAPQPVLELGGADGTGPTMFSHVWGAARTERGLIVMSDEPAQELRVFDATGRHLRTFGRKGEGPGEFRQIRRVAVYGDTVYAMDGSRGIAVFTIDGKLVRQQPYPSLAPYRAVDPWGVLADGSYITTGATIETREILQQAGTHIEMRGLFRIVPDSRSAKLLGVVPTFETYRAANDPPGRAIVGFAPMFWAAVTSDRVCTARGERFEIRCMNSAGESKLIIRREIAATRVTTSARDAYLARIRTPVRTPGHEPMSQAELDQIAARAHFAATFPLFDRLLAGYDNEVWVSEFKYQTRTRLLGEQAPASEMTRWNVFAKDGAWTGAVDLPTRFAPMHVSREHVLGINRDDDGVERVTLFRLLRQ